MAHGGKRVEQLERLKGLEKEDGRQDRLAADRALDGAILKEGVSANRRTRRGASK